MPLDPIQDLSKLSDEELDQLLLEQEASQDIQPTEAIAQEAPQAIPQPPMETVAPQDFESLSDAELDQMLLDQEANQTLPTTPQTEGLAPGEEPGLPTVSAAGGFADFTRGAKKGVTETILPFTDKAQKAAPSQSWTELAGQIVGGLGTDLAAGSAAAGAGAAAGTAILPGVGTVAGGLLGAGLYALYSGVGQEKVASAQSNREFSPTKAVVRSLLNFNPVARVEAAGVKALDQAARAGSKIASAGAKVARASETAAVRGARLAGQVAGEAGMLADDLGITNPEMADTEKAAGVTAAGALTAVMMYPAFRKATVAMSPEGTKALGDFLDSPVGKDLQVRIQNRAEKEIPQNMKLTEKELYDPSFMDYLLSAPSKGETSDSLRTMSMKQKINKMDRMMASDDTGGLGPEKMQEYYRGYRLSQIAREEGAKTHEEIQKSLTKAVNEGRSTKDLEEALEDPIAKSKFSFDSISRAAQVARKVDEVSGLSMNRLVDEYSEGLAVFQRQADALAMQARDAIKMQRKAGLSNEEMGSLRAALGEKDASLIPEKLKPYVSEDFKILNKKIDSAVRQWDKVWENARDTIQTNGFQMGNLEHYLPMRALPRDLLAIQLRRSMKTLQGLTNELGAAGLGVKDISQLTPEVLKKTGRLNDNQIQRILDERDYIAQAVQKAYAPERLKKMDTVKAQALQGEMLGGKARRLIDDLLKESNAKGMGYEMSALYSRGEAKIPSSMRDLDIGRAFQRYLNLNVRGSYLDDLNRRMRDATEILEAAQMPQSADYFRRWLGDQVGEGGSRGLGGWLQDMRSNSRYQIDKYFDQNDWAKSDSGRAVRDFAMAVPDMLAGLQSNMYPAYLGLNIRNATRNMLQPLQTTAPELGGKYGMRTMGHGMVEALKSIRSPDGKISFSNITKELDALGLKSRGPMEGLDEVSVGGGVMRQINEATMKLLEWSDQWNRLVSYKTGQKWAQDILAMDDEAISSMSRMSPAVRNMLRQDGIRKAIETGDAQAAGDLLGRYLVSKTQFHYGAEQKSELQRFMGPMAMFTTWPVEMAGNVYEQLRTNPKMSDKFKRMNQYFLQPLLATYSLAYALDLDQKNPGLMNYLLGSDIAETSSIQTAAQFTPLSIQDSYWPATVAGMAELGIGQLSDPDPQKAKKAAKDLAKTQLKGVVPPVSTVLNELDRWKKRYRGDSEGATDVLMDKLLGDQ